MTAVPFRLEVFDAPNPVGAPSHTSTTEIEEIRLAAYESGYAAGWDDAAAAQSDEVKRLRSDLGRNLQDLSFTYHEAHGHVLGALEPLLAEMVAKVMPRIARESLGAVVVERLAAVAAELADTPVRVVAHPANRKILEETLIADAPVPFVFSEEPSLGEGQVHLGFGPQELRVDLDGMIAAIGAAVANFFSTDREEPQANEHR